MCGSDERATISAMAQDKPLIRCPWSEGVSDAYLQYHDGEWGVPAYDDRIQFEFLTLEAAQAGLSWSTVLHKRAGYQRAFRNFDPEVVARFNRRSVERLCNDASIVRNRLKIQSAINNARQFLKVREEFGSFCNYIWRFVDGKPRQNHWRRQNQVPATTKESDALSHDLKQRGFKFVGSTIIYAHMQATGMVNDHVTGCFRYKACRDTAAS